MRLVSNWRSVWRWNSTHVMAVLAALPLVWLEMPPDAKEMVPLAWRPWIVSGLALAGIVARLRDQGTRS